MPSDPNNPCRAVPHAHRSRAVPFEEATKLDTLVTSGSLTQGNRHILEPSRRPKSGGGAPGAEAGVVVGGC